MNYHNPNNIELRLTIIPPYSKGTGGESMADRDDTQAHGRDTPRSGQATEATSVAPEELAGILSHELRNPLTNAQLYVELAQRDCDSEYLATAVESLERMETLIETFTAVAQTGEDGTEVECVELQEIARRSWADLESSQAQLDVLTDCSVRADRTQLQQLLENLFRNAVEHGAEDVLVRVGTLNDESGFFVEDDGEGMPDEEQSRVFEYGYTTSETGTGYGLAIVREIARVHDWNVNLTEGIDGGVRIEVTGIELL